MMPNRTCRGALQGNDRATGANANTSARSASTAGGERGDHVLGDAGLLDLDQEIERRRGQQRQGVIERERRSPANRGIVRDDEGAPIRCAAHVDLDAGNAKIASRPHEGSGRILLGALAPPRWAMSFMTLTPPGTPRARTRDRA